MLGDREISISGLCTLEMPLPHHITFIRNTSAEQVRKSLELVPATTAVVVSEHLAPSTTPTSGAALLTVKEAYPAFLDLIPLFFEESARASGVHPSAQVDPSASIGDGASVGPGCVIGARAKIGKGCTIIANVTVYEDVMIGDSVTLHAGVSVREGCQIGDRVTIHNNSVIGADGFGYTPDSKLGLRKVPQVGHVRIESDVEIGANSCIDRGAFGPTIVGRGAKIDNLVQIGHNVTIGNFAIICGQVGIAGSTCIGDGVVLGGGAGVADHLSISKGIRVGGHSGVINSLSEPGDYMGFPAVPANDWRRMQVQQRKLIRTGPKK